MREGFVLRNENAAKYSDTRFVYILYGGMDSVKGRLTTRQDFNSNFTPWAKGRFVE